MKFPTLLLSVFLVACASVEPERNRTEEFALSAAPLSAWPSLAETVDTNLFVPMNNGQIALDWRLRALQAATRSIDLQTFIWESDAAGRAIVREVLTAADRGVRVRVILDDSFLAHADPVIRALSEHQNINYRIYNPVAHRDGGAAIRQLSNLTDFSRINHRMHNKLLVVDGRVAIVGGRNQADEYYGYREGHNFRDLEVILQGPMVSRLGGLFDLYWNDPWTIPIEHLVDASEELSPTELADWVAGKQGTFDDPEPATREQWQDLFANGYSGSARLIVDTPADQSPAVDFPVQLAEAYVERIDATERDLLLISAYFIPTEALTSAIERATERGVRVRVLTNSLGSNNHVTAHAAYAEHRPALLKAGAELYELRADASARALYVFNAAEDSSILGLHAKIALFDECCLMVGSSNLDPRSLRLNTEIGALVDSPGLNDHVRELFAIDMLPENAWRVKLKTGDQVVWEGPDGDVHEAPPASFFMRAESWFFGLFPIEEQM
ncbi:MAG: phospholipase D family protein [Halieaceae bacterium]